MYASFSSTRAIFWILRQICIRKLNILGDSTSNVLCQQYAVLAFTFNTLIIMKITILDSVACVTWNDQGPAKTLSFLSAKIWFNRDLSLQHQVLKLCVITTKPMRCIPESGNNWSNIQSESHEAIYFMESFRQMSIQSRQYQKCRPQAQLLQT